MDTHRETDLRACNAGTIAVGNGSVYANDLLVSVEGDPNTDGGGSLIGINHGVYAEDLLCIVVGCHSEPDSLCPSVGDPHCDPYAVTGSADVHCG